MRKAVLISAGVGIATWICWLVIWMVLVRPEVHSTTKPEVLGQFGDWFGALNAILNAGVLVSISLALWSDAESRRNAEAREKTERAQDRRRRVLDLLAEWQSESLHNARTGVYQLTKDFTELKSLTQLDVELRKLFNISKNQEREQKVQDIRSLYRVLYFWERVCVMLEAGDIDAEDTRRYLYAPKLYWCRAVDQLIAFEMDNSEEYARLGLLKRIRKGFKDYFLID